MLFEKTLDERGFANTRLAADQSDPPVSDGSLVQQIVQREREGVALEKFHRHRATPPPQALSVLVRAMSLARPHIHNTCTGSDYNMRAQDVRTLQPTYGVLPHGAKRSDIGLSSVRGLRKERGPEVHRQADGERQAKRPREAEQQRIHERASRAKSIEQRRDE